MAIPPPLPPKPPIKLFVKAGVDGTSYGACPLSQRIYMILSLKSVLGGYSFTVYAVNLARPSEEFKALGLRHVPAVSYLQDHLDNMDEILEYLDNNFPKCDLSYDNVLADKAGKDVFSKFCFFIKSVAKDAFALTQELEKLDKYLAGRQMGGKGSFMCGDRMTYLDCELLPKLQQIRVAGRDIKGFEIPSNLTALWGYLKSAYATEVFRTTCPSDEEITLHWMERTETALTLPKPQRRKSALMNTTQHQYTFDTPLDVKSEEPASGTETPVATAEPKQSERIAVKAPVEAPVEAPIKVPEVNGEIAVSLPVPALPDNQSLVSYV